MTPASFTLDHIVGALDRAPFSPPGALVLLLLSYYNSHRALPTSLSAIMAHLKASKWLRWALVFVGVKTGNRILKRLVMNRGWKADKPRFSLVKGQGDIVVITGGSAGIGKAVVDLLARQTHNIAILDLHPPIHLSPNYRFYQCDVSSASSIALAATQIRSDLGEPTIIINNAGIIRGKALLNTSSEEFLGILAVNTVGCHNMLREFLPHLVKINRGHVMTLASAAAYLSISGLGEYSCSKAASLALHETLVQELVHRYNAPNVRTSIICPTKVATQLGETLHDSTAQFLTPTLTPKWLATRMVAILNGGLSEHLVTPCAVGFLLPLVRLSEPLRAFVHLTSQTGTTVSDARTAERRKHYTVAQELDAGRG